MAIITISINGPGAIHSYKQLAGTNTWQDTGVISVSTTMMYNINDRFRFIAETPFWATFNRYCDMSGSNCVPTPNFEGTITVDTGQVNAYFDYNYVNMSVGAVGLTALGYLGLKYVLPGVQNTIKNLKL